MRTSSALLWLSLATLAATPAHADPAAPQRLTLDQAIEVAAAKNPELALSALSIDAQRYRVKSTRALRLPSLVLKSNLIFWDTALEFSLPTSYVFAEWPAEYPTTPPVIVPDVANMQAMTVRGRVTSSTSLSAIQPLTPLLPFTSLLEVERAGLEAATADHAAARLGVSGGIAQAYLATLQVTAAAEIAGSSVTQVAAQLERARVLAAGDVLERVDVMRLEAALAMVQQQAAAAASGAVQARRQLAFTMGLPATTELEVVDDFPTDPGPPLWTEDRAVELARARRPEILAARHRGQQADAGRDLARWKLLPNVVALATFTHDEGGGVFAIKNSWFLGLNLEWTVWDFGNVYYGLKEAEQRRVQASMAAARLEDKVALEARNGALQARTAFDTIAVARTGLTAAEEAFRLQTIRYAEGATTTTDLLVAETEVTRARLAYTTARYGYFLALVALAQSIGESPASALFGAR
jgi:outer membrane protein TolC